MEVIVLMPILQASKVDTSLVPAFGLASPSDKEDVSLEVLPVHGEYG